MAKLKNPLHSLTADGPLGRLLTYHKYRGQAVARQHSHPIQPNTPPQLTWRTMYQAAIALWHALSPAEKADWNRVARPHHMNGFPFFMSSCLKPNPGIYLPLAGGTMTGPIAMGANKITGLGAPVDPNDAARKADLGGGTFVALSDTPAAYAGQARKLPQVNAGANALEFTKLQGANLSQTFGASATRLNNLLFTPISGEIWREIGTGISPFDASINGAPTPTSVVYDLETNEDDIKGQQSGGNYWGRRILHNTTRANSRKIVSVNIATNTITTEASTDDWTNNDIITTQSQTNAEPGYCDVDLSAHIPATVTAVLLFIFLDNREATDDTSRYIMIHPYTAYDFGYRQWLNATLANNKCQGIRFLGITDQKLTYWKASGCDDINLGVKVIATVEPADT